MSGTGLRINSNKYPVPASECRSALGTHHIILTQTAVDPSHEKHLACLENGCSTLRGRKSELSKEKQESRLEGSVKCWGRVFERGDLEGWGMGQIIKENCCPLGV